MQDCLARANPEAFFGMGRAGGVVLGATVSALFATVFYSTFLFDGYLSGVDWPSNYLYYDWIQVSLSQFDTLPLVQHTSVRTGT